MPSDYSRYHQVKYYKIRMVLTLRLCVLSGSHNKQRFLSYTHLAEWFCLTEIRVFTARYTLSSCIKQTRLVFKGLKYVGILEVCFYVAV
jgi:hypothetical protein